MDMAEIISTQNAPAAIGPYSQAVKANGMLYTSGQIGIVPATGELAEGGLAAQAEQVIWRPFSLRRGPDLKRPSRPPVIWRIWRISRRSTRFMPATLWASPPAAVLR